MDNDGAIVERAAGAQRRTDNQDWEERFAFCFEFGDRFLDGVEEGLLQQQIVNRVAGDRKLRRQQDGGSLCVCFAPEFQNGIRVRGGVGWRNNGRAGSHAHETVRVETAEPLRCGFLGRRRGFITELKKRDVYGERLRNFPRVYPARLGAAGLPTRYRRLANANLLGQPRLRAPRFLSVAPNILANRHFQAV
jgi:hypothetical protein